MSEKITKASPGQWKKIRKLQEEVIEAQTEQVPHSEVVEIVSKVWAFLDLKPTSVVVHPSPFAARRAAGTGSSDSWTIWWRRWVAWYRGGQILGAKLDTEKLEMLSEWVRCVPYYAIGKDGVVHISSNPVAIHWDRDRRLHCEDGQAVRYSDGWGLWAIDGVRVDEQIVMRPETQTIQQIDSDQREERKAIRITRFGWNRYLEDSNSKIVELRKNKVEGTVEILADTPIGQRLITFCPSTGRRFSLSIAPPRVSTCAEAQARLWGDRKVRIIGRT